jgi:NADPH-dependent 2,4-dienoyl-CoA reductase/sulfur reductase-like enzyme
MNVCIIGGGGGASNAANVIRRLDEEAQIDLFNKRSEMGHQPCEIPYVLRGFLSSWQDTFVFRQKFYDERNIKVHLNMEVTDINREEKSLIAGGKIYRYDKAILDLGSISVTPPIPGLNGENEFFLDTSLETARAFEEAISRYSSAAIVGTGQIALDVAEVLKARNYDKIYLLGRSDCLLRAYLDKDMAEIVERGIKEKGIELILPVRINSIKSHNGKKIVSLPDQELEVDFVFFATGSRPNVELARKAGIRIGESGAIAVNEYLQTSDLDIYAIGDCMENWDRITGRKRTYQTATSGATTGRIAATNLIRGNVLPHQGTVMPFVTQVFNYEVGTIGFTETYAREQGLNVVSNMMRTATRRRSFGGKPIHIKLVADPQTKSMVGAQIISEEMVSGKIDRLALAIALRVPVEQLALIDTCYSPPLGSAYESIVMALDQLIPKLT